MIGLGLVFVLGFDLWLQAAWTPLLAAGRYTRRYVETCRLTVFNLLSHVGSLSVKTYFPGRSMKIRQDQVCNSEIAAHTDLPLVTDIITKRRRYHVAELSPETPAHQAHVNL